MLVVSCFCDVANPFNWLITFPLCHFEIPHSHSTTCKHRYLEIHCYGRFVPRSLIFALRDGHFAIENEFSVSHKLFDPPNDRTLTGLILSFGLKLTLVKHPHIRRIWRHRYFNHYISSKVLLVKDAFNLDWVLHLVEFWIGLDHRNYFERQIHVFCDSVAHQFKDSIWWNESYTSISIEPA